MVTSDVLNVQRSYHELYAFLRSGGENFNKAEGSGITGNTETSVYFQAEAGQVYEMEAEVRNAEMRLWSPMYMILEKI